MENQRSSDGTHAPRATVTDIATRRVDRDYIESITLMFDGKHYGTFAVRMPYATTTPVLLYIVPSCGDAGDTHATGPFSCLVTNDPSPALAHDLAR